MVFLIRYPPDVDPRFVNAQSSQPTLPVGVAVPVESHPFSVIFFANESTAKAHLNTSGTSRASVSPVSAAEQMAINTAIQVTKKRTLYNFIQQLFRHIQGHCRS